MCVSQRDKEKAKMADGVTEWWRRAKVAVMISWLATSQSVLWTTKTKKHTTWASHVLKTITLAGCDLEKSRANTRIWRLWFSAVFRYSCFHVHYPHLLSTQISAGECCSKCNTLWCPYRKLCSRQLPRLVTRQKHPTLNSEQKTSTTLIFTNYNPTILQYGSAADTVVSVVI